MHKFSRDAKRAADWCAKHDLRGTVTELWNYEGGPTEAVDEISAHPSAFQRLVLRYKWRRYGWIATRDLMVLLFSFTGFTVILHFATAIILGETWGETWFSNNDWDLSIFVILSIPVAVVLYQAQEARKRQRDEERREIEAEATKRANRAHEAKERENKPQDGPEPIDLGDFDLR